MQKSKRTKCCRGLIKRENSLEPIRGERNKIMEETHLVRESEEITRNTCDKMY